MSKVSTIAVALLLAACARPNSNELRIAPGPNGTYIAVGTVVTGSVSSGKSTFSFSHSNNLSVGVATGGPEPATESETKPFKPASITKLVTTSLGLKKLGPDFTFVTKVAWTSAGEGLARNLVIVADGDPQVVRERSGDGVAQQEVFKEIVTQLRVRGVSKVEGSLTLVSADERHDSAIPANGMEDSDHTTCFGAVSQSFNFGWNCAGLSVESNGQAVWQDSALQFPLTVSAGSGKISVQPNYDSTGRVASFLLSGRPGSRASFKLPISDVKPWYGRAFIAYLNQSGISADVELKTPSGAEASTIKAQIPAPSATGPSFEVVSEPLSSIVQYTNKPSDNYFADDIFKTIAEKHGAGSDLRLEGQAAVREALASWLPSELANEIHLVDGAGLSHENHVTARAYLALLTQFTKESWFPALWESLPIAGKDGTLKARMLGSAAQGKVRAKTGTLSGSYQLAGYVPKYRSDGSVAEYIPFVILSAVDPNQRFDVFDLQTDIASKLVRLVNSK